MGPGKVRSNSGITVRSVELEGHVLPRFGSDDRKVSYDINKKNNYTRGAAAPPTYPCLPYLFRRYKLNV